MSTGKRVYIVDDSADYLFLIKQVFARFLPEFQTRYFNSGDALCHWVRNGEDWPSLVLMDVDMPPGLSGYETLLEVRTHPTWQQVPVVMMSNLVSDQTLRKCLEAGANSFLDKPIGIDQMKQTLKFVCHYWADINRLPN